MSCSIRTPLNSRMTSFTCKIGPLGGRLGFDPRDACADQPAEAERLGPLLVEIDVELHAQKAAGNFVVFHERSGDAARRY